MLKTIDSKQVYKLKNLIEYLNSHHNEVSKNFPGTYPRHSVIDKMNGFIKDLDSNNSKIAVIEVDNEYVGMIKIDFDFNSNKGLLDYFVVLENYHNLGYGKQLMDYAMDQFKQNGMKSIEIHVVYGNETINFYEKYGFMIQSSILEKRI